MILHDNDGGDDDEDDDDDDDDDTVCFSYFCMSLEFFFSKLGLPRWFILCLDSN